MRSGGLIAAAAIFAEYDLGFLELLILAIAPAIIEGIFSERAARVAEAPSEF